MGVYYILYDSGLQFGSTRGVSTTVATRLIKNFNNVSHYVNRDLHVYGSFLDALDRVEHGILFSYLPVRLLPSPVRHLLLIYFVSY